MRVIAFTESVADVRIRYQIIRMDASAMVWIQTEAEGSSGSLPSMALSLACATATGALPPGATVLRGAGSSTSRGVAQKLARRSGLAVYAHVSLADDSMALLEAALRRVTRELV